MHGALFVSFSQCVNNQIDNVYRVIVVSTIPLNDIYVGSFTVIRSAHFITDPVTEVLNSEVRVFIFVA